MTGLSQRDFEGLLGPIILKQFRGRALNSMSVQELKDALRSVPGFEGMTMGYASNGNQRVRIGDTIVEFNAMASNDEIRAAFLTPTIPTQNTKVTVKPMSTKLQGLAAKISKFKHDAEFEAEKLDAKIEGASARIPGVFSGAHGAIDGITKQVDDVNAILTEIATATNGGPA